MSRSLKKGPFIQPALMKKVQGFRYVSCFVVFDDSFWLVVFVEYHASLKHRGHYIHIHSHYIRIHT